MGKQVLDRHPLGDFVLAAMAANPFLDVTDLSGKLAGVLGWPPKRTRAYRIVAADILVNLLDRGEIEQHGSWVSPRRRSGAGLISGCRGFGCRVNPREEPARARRRLPPVWQTGGNRR